MPSFFFFFGEKGGVPVLTPKWDELGLVCSPLGRKIKERVFKRKRGNGMVISKTYTSKGKGGKDSLRGKGKKKRGNGPFRV